MYLKKMIIYSFLFIVVKVKCRELVRKIATYKTILAVSLNDLSGYYPCN
jgi:hypothetical protein